MRGNGSRILAVAALAAALSGCGLGIPSSVTVASYAADGVSYALTGKGMADHALSAAAERDCALLRAAYREPVCRPDAKIEQDKRDERRAALAAALSSGAVPSGVVVLDVAPAAGPGAVEAEPARQIASWAPVDDGEDEGGPAGVAPLPSGFDPVAEMP
jgi:hypothetical protein